VLPGLPALAAAPFLYQKPTLNRTHVVFEFANDLWSVPREGGEARRLTADTGRETEPVFSPDGTQVAFTGEYDGNTDVFLIPAGGGVPKRLTYHPAIDRVVGWTPDSKRVIFRSFMLSPNWAGQLFTVSTAGEFPQLVPLPMADSGSFSPDGSQIAYMPLAKAFDAWKRYRGGRTTTIWLANVSDSGVTAKVPRDNSNDLSPMWIGNKVYFLSDRNGPVTLFSYDVQTKKVAELIKNTGLDYKWASAGPDAIALEQFGEIKLYDLKSGKLQPVKITVAGDLPAVRPRFEKGRRFIVSAALSPTGARALFEARGEILTLPAEKGSFRNLTNTPGVAERDPSWSPDGSRIAYFSDEAGEYMLHVRSQDGMGDVEKIRLSDSPAFYYSPTWSPDSKKIAYYDKAMGLWFIDLEKKTPVRIDQGTYNESRYYLSPNWSPDSKWLAYAKQLKNRLTAIHLYSLESGKTHQVTDGMSMAMYPRFDKNGKYLYFMASTDAGPTTGGLDLSSYNRPVTSNVYVTVLSKDEPSPIAPESDEEKVAEEKKPDGETSAEKKPAEKKDAVVVKIDLDNIGQRILALPVPQRSYRQLALGKSGVLFLFEGPAVPAASTGPSSQVVHKFELSKRKMEKFLEGVSSFRLSYNGEKAMYTQGERWAICSTAAQPKPGEGSLKMDEMEIWVDPKAEWKQMYNEVWRLERDFFYAPNWHGLDLKAAARRYEPYLEHLAARSDLNYLFQEMLGELSVGHLYVRGGDAPEKKPVKGGLLGADYRIENGRYRFSRVYNGENWNPELRAPLTQPGVNVKEGEYLLAVNGKPLTGTDNIFAFFEGTAGRSVVIKVGQDPTGANAREVTVVPLESEASLRNLAWAEGNRRKVDEMSGGKLAYMHLPDTATGGYNNFNRYYFAQTDKQGAVIDERFNRGGKAADYIIDHLRRPLLNYWTPRDGADYATPATAIFGPKVMIVNEYAGSGGDAMPWYFRRAGVGLLVGKRTWGGLVGIGGYPQLIDGGSVTAPHFAFWNPDGKWDVENYGTPPDIEVDLDPKAWREGRDTQLEKAVQVALAELKEKPLPVHKRPAYPDYHTKETGVGRKQSPVTAGSGAAGGRLR
jgi:tricorn protease